MGDRLQMKEVRRVTDCRGKGVKWEEGCRGTGGVGGRLQRKVWMEDYGVGGRLERKGWRAAWEGVEHEWKTAVEGVE